MSTGIGARLKMARSLANMSQRDVAAQMALSPMMISKYENEHTLPNSETLLRLARVFAQPVEFFLRGPAIPVITPLYHGHTTFRTKDEEVIVAQLQTWMERYLAVESLYPPSELVHFTFPAGFPYTITALAQVEAAADSLRQAWGLGDSPIDNLTELLEDKGIKVGLIDYDGQFATSLFRLDDNLPVMMVKSGAPGDQQRLNLARELGYLMLNFSEEIDEAKATMRFAGAFLIPRAAANRELGRQRHTLDIRELYLLRDKYGVNEQTYVTRAQELTILRESNNKYSTQLQHKLINRHESASVLPSEKPQRLTRLVLRALAEGIITESRASELLGIPWHEFIHQT